jgi:hypothetical protein
MSRDMKHTTFVWVVVCLILFLIMMIGFGELS